MQYLILRSFRFVVGYSEEIDLILKFTLLMQYCDIFAFRASRKRIRVTAGEARYRTLPGHCHESNAKVKTTATLIYIMYRW